MSLEQLWLQLEDLKAQSKTQLFGVSVDPPYTPTTVKRALNVLTNHCEQELFSLNKTRAYARYLQKRFPCIGEVENEVGRCRSNYKKIASTLAIMLDEYIEGMRKKRQIIRQVRSSDQVQHCQLCEFDYRPLLQLHHLIPLAEGGDNQTLVILCPLCHEGVHQLTKVTGRADTNQGKREFKWWVENQDKSGWWAKAGEGIEYFANLYIKSHENENYEGFVASLLRSKLQVPVHTVEMTGKPRLVPLAEWSRNAWQNGRLS